MELEIGVLIQFEEFNSYAVFFTPALSIFPLNIIYWDVGVEPQCMGYLPNDRQSYACCQRLKPLPTLNLLPVNQLLSPSDRKKTFVVLE